MGRLVVATCAAMIVAGCGATAAPSTAGGPASSSAAGGSGSAGGSLTVSGSVSATVNESRNSANMCQRGSGGTVSGILNFDTYSLQFFLSPGDTHFPNTSGTSGVAFFNNSDSTQEWAIGTRQAASAAGSVTVAADGKSGTVDVDMVPNPPEPNPALKPIHVKGTFSCT